KLVQLIGTTCFATCFTLLIHSNTHQNLAVAQTPLNPTDQCKSEFRLALDVGHTPELFGTLTARGHTEYEFNLSLAEAVRDTLASRGYKNVFLIKMAGKPDPLEKRDIEANALKANLFISLHHDSVQPSYLKTWIVDGRRQEYNDDVSGYSIFVSEKNS